MYVAIERTIKKYISPVQSQPCWSVSVNKEGGWIFRDVVAIRVY